MDIIQISRERYPVDVMIDSQYLYLYISVVDIIQISRDIQWILSTPNSMYY